MKPYTSEWREERDQFGGIRRYRMVGNTKEYEMLVSVDGLEIPISELAAYHERKKAASRAAEKPSPAASTCPFMGRCTKACARKAEGGCGIVAGEAPAVGKRCPFGDKKNPFLCREDCALWTMCNGREETEE